MLDNNVIIKKNNMEQEIEKLLLNSKDTLLGYKKTLNIINELNSIKHLEGNTAEIGVYEGQTSKLIHTIMNDRIHYAYDTFNGIGGSDESIDYHKDGEFKCPIEIVKSNIDMDNVVYKIGLFPETFEENSDKFMFVHSDTDTYFGTKKTLEIFPQLMVSGGKIVFDDYQWKNCPGVELAILEFMSTNNDFTSKIYDNSYYCPYGTHSPINQCVLTKK
jgi:hypothetical protein